MLSTPPKHLFGCLIKLVKSNLHFFWVKSPLANVDHCCPGFSPPQVAPKSLPRSPAHAFHRPGAWDYSTSWGISQAPGLTFDGFSRVFPCLCHREITMKSPWNHHEITMKSPWNHHEVTMKSPWNHHEITMKWSLRRSTKRSWKTRKLRNAGAMKVSSKVAIGNPPNSWRLFVGKA